MTIQSHSIDMILFVEHNEVEYFTNSLDTSIPQGSNMGPLLFLILINDLTNT